MPKTQKLIKKEIEGRSNDKAAALRIDTIVSSEKTEMEKKYDGTTREPKNEDMSKVDLIEYQNDLAKRLMVFEAESHEIRTEIKKVGLIIKKRP